MKDNNTLFIAVLIGLGLWAWSRQRAETEARARAAAALGGLQLQPLAVQRAIAMLPIAAQPAVLAAVDINLP